MLFLIELFLGAILNPLINLLFPREERKQELPEWIEFILIMISIVVYYNLSLAMIDIWPWLSEGIVSSMLSLLSSFVFILVFYRLLQKFAIRWYNAFKSSTNHTSLQMRSVSAKFNNHQAAKFGKG